MPHSHRWGFLKPLATVIKYDRVWQISVAAGIWTQYYIVALTLHAIFSGIMKVLFVPSWTVRTVLGLFVPGLFVPWTVRTLVQSTVRTVQGTNSE